VPALDEVPDTELRETLINIIGGGKVSLL
jgi:hypothetical protein